MPAPMLPSSAPRSRSPPAFHPDGSSFPACRARVTCGSRRTRAFTSPPGVLEMEVSWADPAHRFYTGTSVGDEHQGVQHIGFLRDMGDGAHETIVIRYPEGRLAFQARMPKGWDSQCEVRIVSLRQGTALWRAYEHVPGAPPVSLALTVAAPPRPVPAVLHSTIGFVPVLHAVAQRVAGWVFAPYDRLDAFELDPVKPHPVAWVSTDGRLIEPNALTAWGAQLHFHLLSSTSSSETWVWDSSNGARPFLATTGEGPGQVGRPRD